MPDQNPLKPCCRDFAQIFKSQIGLFYSDKRLLDGIDEAFRNAVTLINARPTLHLSRRKMAK